MKEYSALGLTDRPGTYTIAIAIDKKVPPDCPG